jgi:hypothetical protein
VAGRKLKVFQAQFGFFDTVVAAPSRAAALRAWGVRQDLFAGGQARVTDDPQAVEAALAHPGTPLRRAVGSHDPFALNAKLPKVPDLPQGAPKAKAKPRAALPAKPPADRSVLDAAVSALRKIEQDRKREEADLVRRQEALDQKREAAQTGYMEARKALAVAVAKARHAWRKAGGED